MKFFQARIKSIEPLTDAASDILLEVAPDDRHHFVFKAGQYIVLSIPELDASIHRSYSISAAPYEGQLHVGVKKVNAGVMSTYLTTKAQIGDTINIMPPSGSFCIPMELTTNRIIAFVSGSGITPVLSIIKEQLNSNPLCSITLFYGNKDSFSRMYLQELDLLMSSYGARLEVNYIYSRQKTGLSDFEGRIDAVKLNSWKNYLFEVSAQQIFLICGPGDMVSTLEKELIKLGVSQEMILTEYFTPPQLAETKPILLSADQENHVIRIKNNKKWHTIHIKNNQEVILDLGLKQGIDLPYSCKSGVCSTCQAKLIKGEVRMDNNYVLSDKELQLGMILTCQSHALTPEVEVDYDM